MDMSSQSPSKLEINPESDQIENMMAKDTGRFVLDPKAEKALLRKCDLHVLPCLTVIYFLSFMDRTNIGPLHYLLLLLSFRILTYRVYRQCENTRADNRPQDGSQRLQYCFICVLYTCE